MTGWSLDEAIAMEKRHILEGETRIARQVQLAGELVEKGYDQSAATANQLLDVFRDIQEIAKCRLQYLEGQAHKQS
jgi:hypothetical protein